MRLSVDGGSPEAFEQFRPPAKWEKVCANIRRFIELYSSAERSAILSLYREGRKREIELCRACTGYHEGIMSRLLNLLRKL